MDFKPMTDYVPCPFCSGEYVPVEMDDGGYAVAHSQPECAQFTVMDVLTFLQAAREKRESKLPKGNN